MSPAARGGAPRLVIFDCDGVLVDSEPLSNGVLAEMLSEQGLSMTVDEARASFQGLLLEQVLAKAERRVGHPLPEAWLQEFVERRAAVFAERLQPVPGAAELVESLLAAGVAVCVASQGRLRKTDASLSITGLEHLFAPAARFSAEQVPRGKPHPDLFLHAARAMGASPGECAVVEDTPSGVLAAVRAEMAVYGYAADSEPRALELAGARVVMTLAELGPVLAPAARGDSTLLPCPQG